ncbi:MAG: hypothetical protein JWM57_2062, partial [Phycisphaerales bacterium]|nr:hypothetical protein [Phycisphaerales bacterium]
GLRKNTLVVFAGDNGTAVGRPSTVGGRVINGAKGSMLEGGSHIPFIVSWPAVTPAGKISKDLISFADPYATFAELAGAKLPEKIKIDGQSFAAQVQGQTGTPREIAYVQLGERWFVRDAGYKLNEKGELFDLSDAPFVETLIPAETDTETTKAERKRLTAALAGLDPANGKTDEAGGGGGARRQRRQLAAATTKPAGEAGNTPPAGPWKAGDQLASAEAPQVSEKPLEVSADVDAAGKDGVIVAQGGVAHGYALYVKDGKLAFSVRESRALTTISANDALGAGHFQIRATLQKDGALALFVDGKQVATGKAAGLIPQQPRAGFTVGKSGAAAVGDYAVSSDFEAKVTNVRVKTAAAG